MKHSAISREARSTVIERFIGIEWLINCAICQHYLKRVSRPFLVEVLYDEQCSFGLRRKILEKIAPSLQPHIQNLNRLNVIRNYFAHCGQAFFDLASPDASYVPDPRHPERKIDFEAMFKEFEALAPDLEQALFKVYTDLGGQSEPIAFDDAPGKDARLICSDNE